MLLNSLPGKDLPALSAPGAQETDDPQDAGEHHLGQPGKEVAGGGHRVLLLGIDSTEKMFKT